MVNRPSVYSRSSIRGGVREQFNIELVKQIQRHKILYNCFASPSKTHQENSWMQIANELKMSVENCKLRWKNIRHAFLRHLRTRSMREVSGGKPYYLAPYLKFFEPFANFKPKFFSNGQLLYKVTSLKQEVDQDIDLELKEGDTNYIEGEEEEDEESSKDGLIDPLTTNVPTPCSSADSSILTPTISLVKLEPSDILNDTDEGEVEEDDFLQDSTKRPSRTMEHHAFDSQQLSEKQIRTINPQSSITTIDEDPDLNFFKSILPELKLLNSRQKLQFRASVLNSLSNILTDIPSTSAVVTSSSSISTKTTLLKQ